MKLKDSIVYSLLLLLVGYFFYSEFVKDAPDYSFLIDQNNDLKKRLEKIEESYNYHDRAEAFYIEKIDSSHAKIDTTNKPGLRALFTDFKRRTE